ncbi:MAG: hypothetical protein M1830_006504 [Pleopsidium flavum]|nr:MAG: hypothetical protein M1830_006504 [Pleopsidium flavum]
MQLKTLASILLGLGAVAIAVPIKQARDVAVRDFSVSAPAEAATRTRRSTPETVQVGESFIKSEPPVGQSAAEDVAPVGEAFIAGND